MYWSGLNSDLKHLLNIYSGVGGGQFVKNQTNKLMKTLKNGQK